MAEPVAASEQIMQAIVARLGTLTIPGLVIEQDENPDFGARRFIHVSAGSETNLGPDQFGTSHTSISLEISFVVGASIGIGEQMRVELGKLLAELKRVLREDDTLGGICYLRWLSSTYAPPDEEDGQPRLNIATSEWQAEYTHPYDDPYTIFLA